MDECGLEFLRSLCERGKVLESSREVVESSVSGNLDITSDKSHLFRNKNCRVSFYNNYLSLEKELMINT